MVAMPNPTVDTTSFLVARGISQETAARYRITALTYKGRPALQYPTYGDKGAVGWRIRYTDGNTPKYEWKEHHAENVYYSPGMLLDAIQANNGVLYVLNGEPAIWAHHSYQVSRGKDKELAAPSVAWFGENSVPATLADDFKAWGVTSVYVFPDCDEIGYRSALKVHDLLALNFKVQMVDLPFAYGSKKDFNDLWIEAGGEFSKMATLKPLSSKTMFEREPKLKAVERTAEQFRPMQTPLSTDAPRMENWVADIIASLGAPDAREGRIDRWHCPVHTPDTHPSFRVEYKAGELPRPRCSCDIHSHADAWGEIARAKGQPTWEEYKAQHAPAKKPPLQFAQAQPASAPIEERVKRALYDGDAALQEVLATAKGDTSHLGNPVVFPYTALHSIGGLCHYIPSGMLIGVIAASGEGKTSFMEGGIDAMNRAGLDVVVFSPEWTPQQMAQRRIQRYSGRNGKPFVSVADDLVANELWLKETGYGVPVDQRPGKALTDLQIKEIENITRYLCTFPGKAQYIYGKGATITLEDFLEIAAAIIQSGRERGRRADAVVFDYVQLTQLRDAPPDGANAVEHAVGLIKAHAIEHKYVGFIASQVTKSGSKASKVDGTMITSDDAMFVRSDKFNLVLTLNREYTEQANEAGEIENLPTDFGYIYVDKNSLGISRKRVKVQTDFTHLRWIDKAVGG